MILGEDVELYGYMMGVISKENLNRIVEQHQNLGTV